MGDNMSSPSLDQMGPEREKSMSFYFPFRKDVNMDKLRISDVGKYSVSRPKYAEKTAQIIAEYFQNPEDMVITDATSGVGGDIIAFSKYFKYVNAVEILPEHCEILRNNIEQYQLTGKVDIINCDYIQIMNHLQQDIIYFDPPWGGPDYRHYDRINLYLGSRRIETLVSYLIPRVKMIAIKIPFNFNFLEFYKHIDKTKHQIELHNLKKFQLIVVYHNSIEEKS